MLFAAACSWDSDQIQSPTVIDLSSCEAQSLPQTITFYHSFCYCDKIFSENFFFCSFICFWSLHVLWMIIILKYLM